MAKDPVRLLIIDDQSEFCEIIRMAVDARSSALQIDCEFAENLEQLDAAMKIFEPTVALIDAHITNLDSISLIQRLSDELIPVVVTSEHASSDISASARKHGADGYLEKTFDPDEIDFLLHQLVEIANDTIIKQ